MLADGIVGRWSESYSGERTTDEWVCKSVMRAVLKSS